MRLEEAEVVRVRPSGRAPRLFQFEKVAGEDLEAGADRSLGTLEVPRRGAAIFRCGEDAFFLERGKGWIRSYFQIWDAERAWLGASYRWNPLRRRIVVHVANGTYNLVPSAAFGRGFRLVDTRGEVVLAVHPERAFRREWVIHPFRRIEFATAALVYFLARRHASESFLPAGKPRAAKRT